MVLLVLVLWIYIDATEKRKKHNCIIKSELLVFQDTYNTVTFYRVAHFYWYRKPDYAGILYRITLYRVYPENSRTEQP